MRTAAEVDLEWGRGGQGGRPRLLKPDAWFVYGLRNGGRLAAFLEVDRGTERGMERWAQKFDAYARLFLTDGLVEFTTGQQQARVLVITPDDTRRDALAAMLGEWLAASDVPPDRFWLAARDALSTDLGRDVWRVPERDGLLPLVPERYR